MNAGERGEEFIRRKLAGAESPIECSLRLLSFRRPSLPMLIFGFRPLKPFGICLLLGWGEIAIGPHYVFKLRRRK